MIIVCYVQINLIKFLQYNAQIKNNVNSLLKYVNNVLINNYLKQIKNLNKFFSMMNNLNVYFAIIYMKFNNNIVI